MRGKACLAKKWSARLALQKDRVQGLPCEGSQTLVNISKASLALQEQVSPNSLLIGLD